MLARAVRSKFPGCSGSVALHCGDLRKDAVGDEALKRNKTSQLVQIATLWPGDSLVIAQHGAPPVGVRTFLEGMGSPRDQGDLVRVLGAPVHLGPAGRCGSHAGRLRQFGANVAVPQRRPLRSSSSSLATMQTSSSPAMWSTSRFSVAALPTVEVSSTKAFGTPPSTARRREPSVPTAQQSGMASRRARAVTAEQSEPEARRPRATESVGSVGQSLVALRSMTQCSREPSFEARIEHVNKEFYRQSPALLPATPVQSPF